MLLQGALARREIETTRGGQHASRGLEAVFVCGIGQYREERKPMYASEK